MSGTFAGTCNGNVPGVAAALACIEILERGRVHEHVFRLGERMRTGLREVAARCDVPATVNGFGSVFVLCFMDGPLETYDDTLRNDAGLFVRYRRELTHRGVFEMPENLGPQPPHVQPHGRRRGPHSRGCRGCAPDRTRLTSFLNATRDAQSTGGGSCSGSTRSSSSTEAASVSSGVRNGSSHSMLSVPV